MNIRTKELVLAGLFTALIIIGAYIKVFTQPVPITLQFLFVLLAGAILGPRLGALSVLTYVILGLVGVPVFTKGGGPSYVLQPTFGYLVGFILGAYISGWLIQRFDQPAAPAKIHHYLFAYTAALLIMYIPGVAYLFVAGNFLINQAITWEKAITAGFLVPIPWNMLLVVLLSLISPQLIRRLRQALDRQ